MKGKVTKDIILNVGQGIIRIPREKAVDYFKQQLPENSSHTKKAGNTTKPENKHPRS